MSQIFAFTGSSRKDSFNKTLLDQTLSLLRGYEQISVDHVHTDDYDFPLYSQDLETGEGFPPEVVLLAERFGQADAVLVASPEYNGGYSPLFKNTLDWISRTNRKLEPKFVGLLTASPSPGGARRAATQMKELFEFNSFTVHDPAFSVPRAYEALAANPTDGLEQWVGAFVEAVEAFTARKPTET